MVRRTDLCVLAAAASLFLQTAVKAQETSEQPKVLAAWSQVFGVSDPTVAEGLVPPAVEMRFVLEPGGDCGSFGVQYRRERDTDWQEVPVLPTARSDGADAPLAVVVCALPMETDGEDWYVARLRWGAGEAVLTSMLVGGDTEPTIGSTFSAGPADGEPVQFWGGASIGRRAAGEADRLVLVTLGDTGCRGLPDGWDKPQLSPGDEARLQRMTQHCDPQSWPLANLASRAAMLPGPAGGSGAGTTGPDLVIHVGDYRYFLEDQVPHPKNGWLYWQKDFFPAVQPLLLAGPFVATRGNHEACGDWGFGDGYFQLFGAGAITSCAGAPDPIPPQAFDVAPGGLEEGVAAAHRFVVLDTNDDAAAGLTESYQTAMALTRAAGAPSSAWWVTHVPAITLVDFGTPPEEHTGDPELQSDLIAAAGGDLAAWFCNTGQCRPSQILLGHQHLYQSIEFPAGGEPGAPWVLPRHVVVGHGGTVIDKASPAPVGAARCRYAGFAALAAAGNPAPVGIVETQTAHGLVAWMRDATTLNEPSGWSVFEMLWADSAPAPRDGTAMAPCDE